MDLLECIIECFIPKLSKNLDDCEDHPEFSMRLEKLSHNFHTLIKLIGDADFNDQQETSLAAIFMLNLELQSDGPWHTEKCKEYSDFLNHTFELNYRFKLDNLLLHSEIFNTQNIFDICIDDLHRKLTSSDFKKYPSLNDVYYRILENIREYNIAINPVSVLPISLLLIDDYVIANKIKGLNCCLSVLDCLSTDAFQNGNYYEVIYVSLMRSFPEKNIEVTKLTVECLIKFLMVLPENVKISKTDNTYKTILNQIYSESNLYKKAICFNFTKSLIEILGVNCAKWKIFQTVTCDALDICTNSAVGEIMLQDTLECLQVWLKHCWCVWRLSTEHNMLSKLLKLLYVVRRDETALVVQNLIMTVITLCTKEEQNEICKKIEMSREINRDCPKFIQIVDTIKQVSVCK